MEVHEDIDHKSKVFRPAASNPKWVADGFYMCSAGLDSIREIESLGTTIVADAQSAHLSPGYVTSLMGYIIHNMITYLETDILNRHLTCEMEPSIPRHVAGLEGPEAQSSADFVESNRKFVILPYLTQKSFPVTTTWYL